MAGRIVCNASPLIFLSKLDKFSLLDAHELHVPAQVEAEILQGAKHKKQDAAKIADYLRARHIKSEKVILLRDLPRPGRALRHQPCVQRAY
jgi:predicted nucleic acid-binding protein